MRSLAAPTALLALAVAAGGCSLFDRSHEDEPAPTIPLPVPPPPPATSVFNLHRSSDDNANVIIEKVTLEPTATTVEMSYTNAGRTGTEIMLAPPGDPEVMFLEAGAARAKLRSADGIATLPSRTKVAPGETKTFTIVFDPLPPGTRTFDLYEGEQGKMAKIGGGSFWVFRGVKLQ